MTVPREIEAGLPDMVAWRRAFHRLPELAYEEHRTAATVSELLRGFGVDEIATGIGGTGVVALIRNGEGPRVALRADMDALPIAETGTPPWRSEVEGRMHACGHDGHMTMLLGAARYLAAARPFAGTVVLIFQPAEEGRAGARAMLDDGILDRFPFDRVFALHNIPGLPAAEIAASPGAVMAAVDRFTLTVTGTGGHAAMPQLNRDPILAGSALVMALQSIVSRNQDPRLPAVVTVTRFNAGEADNATPGSASLLGNVRFLEPGGSDVFRERIARIARGVAATYGVEIGLDYVVGRPATINAETEARIAREAAASLGPLVTLAPVQAPIMASEDFSYFLEARPGAFAFLGAGVGRPSLHSPDFDFNDAILVPGASFLARLAERALLG
jgi:hippurate hydrolase